MTSLPLELQQNIFALWLSADKPSIDNWVKELKNTPKYARLPLTKPKLLHALRAEINKLGYPSITAYRDKYESKSSKTIPMEFNQKENKIPIIFEESNTKFEESVNGAVASSTSTSIRSPEELIKACKIDVSLWEIESYKVKTYQGYRALKQKNLSYSEGKAEGYIIDNGDLQTITMYSVEVRFKPRLQKPFEEVLDRLLDRLRKQPKINHLKKSYPKGEYLFIPAIFDTHFGRRDLTNTYSPERTKAEFIAASTSLIQRTSSMQMTIDRILLPVGNDVLNADNLIGTTTKGTLQEMSADLREAIDAACQSYITLIEQLIEVAPVDVVIVQSNHDRLGTFWLGKVVEAWFNNHRYAKYIHIDNRLAPRKYYSYGANLLGMDHGDNVKAADLALIMATEAPQLWGDTRYRTFLRGHFHTERALYHAVSDERGVSVITFPAFCPADQWELLMGYIGNQRRAEGRFYHKENGPAGVFPIFIDELIKVN